MGLGDSPDRETSTSKSRLMANLSDLGINSSQRHQSLYLYMIIRLVMVCKVHAPRLSHEAGITNTQQFSS